MYRNEQVQGLVGAQYVGQGAGYATSGYIQEVPQTQPRFDSLADGFERLAPEAAKVLHRLRLLADRYGGPTPEAVGKGGENSSKTSVIARLEFSHSELEGLLAQINGQIDRLERF